MTHPLSNSTSVPIPEISGNLQSPQQVVSVNTTESAKMAGYCVSSCEVNDLRMIDVTDDATEAIDNQDIMSRQGAHLDESRFAGSIMGLPLEMRNYIICNYLPLADILKNQLSIQTILESGIEDIVRK